MGYVHLGPNSCHFPETEGLINEIGIHTNNHCFSLNNQQKNKMTNEDILQLHPRTLYTLR